MLIHLKKYIARNFESLAFFYRYLGSRILIALIISLCVGILDGLGLSMFLPLLHLISDGGSAGGDLGSLQFLADAINALGLDLNLIVVLGSMVLFFTFKGLFLFLSHVYRTIVQQFFISKIRIILINSFNDITFRYFVGADIGRIQNTMTGEVLRINQAYQTYFRAVEQAILVLVYMGFAFFVDMQFALLITVGGILTNFIYKSIYKKTKGLSKKITKDSHLFEGLIIQHVNNYKYLKATNGLYKNALRIKNSIADIENSNKRVGILNGILTGVREPVLILVVAAVILFQARILEQPLGPILISLLFFYRALTALMNMQHSWNFFIGVSGSLENLQVFQQQLTSHKEESGDRHFTSLQQGLQLENLSVKFEGNQVLQQINLRIAKNTTVAFVGESGSGKTTLINVLSGLLPPDDGQFLIDGTDFNLMIMQEYRQRVGYITQETVIFNDTIYNNVTLWDKKTPDTLDRFHQAIQQASLGSFVKSLQYKEETLLGNNGINISGGQKQRISIARELYKEIDLLILDEATSALDSKTEKEIHQAVQALQGKYTIILVAHRLSTVKTADQIVFLDKGIIKSVGDYGNLLNIDSEFRKMAELQNISN